MSDQQRHSPLHDWHERAGAKFAEFGGWQMPLEYLGGGVIAEHTAVRTAVGLFDVSHLGKLRVSGAQALDYLNTRLSNDFGKVGPGKAQYHLLCNAGGGVIDDLVAYIVSANEVLLVPNAANAQAVAETLAHGAPQHIRISDLHQEQAIIAVQGPRSAELLRAVGLPTELDYMAFEQAQDQVTVCRSGYTGELGYEIVLASSAASRWWRRLLAAGEPLGVAACGLGARDTLRTEMGYPLHGNDLAPSIDALSAGMSWAIGWHKPAFDGRDALLAIKRQGPARLLRGLLPTGRAIPRPGMAVVDISDGSVIGQITSGTFSPTLKTGIGLALVGARFAIGDRVGVQVRTRVEEFELVSPPFVASRVR